MDSIIASGESAIRIVPLSRTIISFAMYSISLITCVANSTILSNACSAIRLRNRMRSLGSNPAVGSSNIKTRGLFKSACASKRRCFIPPEYSRIFLFFTSSRFTSVKSSVVLFFASDRFIPLSAAIYHKNCTPVNASASTCCCGM